MEERTFDQIMEAITAGLTGDSDKDVSYLEEQMEKYKGHEYGKEIIRACGRLLYEVLPEEKKAEISKVIENDHKAFDAALEEVRFNQYKKDYERALKLIKAMVKKYEELNMYQNDEVSEYYRFNEPMEEIIYQMYHHPEKTIRQAQIPYEKMYLQYGSILIDLKQFDEAETMLAKAKRWNPSDADIAFEYIETFKARGKMDYFGRLSREVFKIAFRPNALARCYRNMAYYYVEMKEYETAVCCLEYSAGFERNQQVPAELYYISQVTGKNYQPTYEEIKGVLESHDIPLGPDLEILKTAYSYGLHFYEQGDKKTAAYFLLIFSLYVNDEKVERILKEILPPRK